MAVSSVSYPRAECFPARVLGLVAPPRRAPERHRRRPPARLAFVPDGTRAVPSCKSCHAAVREPGRRRPVRLRRCPYVTVMTYTGGEHQEHATSTRRATRRAALGVARGVMPPAPDAGSAVHLWHFCSPSRATESPHLCITTDRRPTRAPVPVHTRAREQANTPLHSAPKARSAVHRARFCTPVLSKFGRAEPPHFVRGRSGHTSCIHNVVGFVRDDIQAVTDACAASSCCPADAAAAVPAPSRRGAARCAPGARAPRRPSPPGRARGPRGTRRGVRPARRSAAA